MTYTGARGPAGDRCEVHGDLTGSRFRVLTEDKKDRELIVQQTLSEIRSDDDIAIVVIPGGKSYAVPRAVIRFLQAK